MHTSQGPTLDETLTFVKRAGFAADKNRAKQHLENLLYMKSVLYLDDKNNEKHMSRIKAVLDSVKKEYSKELSEVAPAEGTIYLVAQILVANKIIDAGITRVKALIERGGPVSREQEMKPTDLPQVVAAAKAGPDPARPTAGAAISPPEVKENPKLRETLGFLVSIVGDPLRTTNKIPAHLSNLEKISKLIKRNYQDLKIQKINENILGILGKIFGTNSRKETNQALDNSLKILKNLPQYKTLIGVFEADVKNYILAQVERGTEATTASRLAHVDQFYADFKDEKNMVKKVNMLRTVLTSPSYKYDKELNAASLKLLKGLEAMGLHLDAASLGPEKGNK